MDDPGESLVGSYLHYVVGCQLVLHNTFTPEEQGELDVVGIQLSGSKRVVWFCEATTHIQGLNYGDFDTTVKKVSDKIRRAKRFADLTFPEDDHRYEIWSPVVSVGRMTKAFEELENEFSDADLDFKFIINELTKLAPGAEVPH